MTDDLCALPATRLASLIATGAISSVEAIRASLARIAAVQPALNPFCYVFETAALAEAERADAAVRRGDRLGPLHGVPIAIKDFTPTAGLVTTRGSAAFRDWVPDHDALIVRRLRAAGAIMVGKTTTPEFAFSSFTRSPVWGDTLNPWDATRTSGGSSGGSAVAVATGCVALAEGTDMGGSVRIPAALCGIVGLKPSLGRIPMDILPTSFDTISHFGPLARSVEDAALFLSVTEGPDDSDILSQAAPLPVGDLSRGVAGLRIALSPDLGYFDVQADVAANLRDVAAALAEAGAIVEEVELGWTAEVFHVHAGLWQVYIAAAFGHLLDEYRERMDPDVVALIEAGRRLDAVTYRRLDEARTRHWHQLARVLATHDAMICPTMARTAPPASAHDADYETINAAGRLAGLDMTGAFNNVAQCPALSVPSGRGADGLPTAVQIIGRRFDDGMTLRIGAALERLRPLAAPARRRVNHAGMTHPAFAPVAEAVRAERIPGAVLGVLTPAGRSLAADGWAQIEPDRVPMRTETWFDLASLTKVIATTPAVLRLAADGRIGLDDPLIRAIPDLRQYDAEAAERRLTFRQCLSHATHLPAVEPLYTYGQDPATLRAFVLQRQWRAGPPVYSDINFILLGIAIERLTGRPLADLPLPPGFGFAPDPAQCAATEHCRWREKVLRGEVHDENAAALGGAAGHAGLFGAADAVLDFAAGLLAGATPEIREPAGPTRTLGWERKHPGWAGGEACSEQTIGHTGFTGTGLWVDFARNTAWTLLTNRVHPTRHRDSGIQALRRAVADLVILASA